MSGKGVEGGSDLLVGLLGELPMVSGQPDKMSNVVGGWMIKRAENDVHTLSDRSK